MANYCCINIDRVQYNAERIMHFFLSTGSNAHHKVTGTYSCEELYSFHKKKPIIYIKKEKKTKRFNSLSINILIHELILKKLFYWYGTCHKGWMDFYLA